MSRIYSFWLCASPAHPALQSCSNFTVLCFRFQEGSLIQVQHKAQRSQCSTIWEPGKQYRRAEVVSHGGCRRAFLQSSFPSALPELCWLCKTHLGASHPPPLGIQGFPVISFLSTWRRKLTELKTWIKKPYDEILKACNSRNQYLTPPASHRHSKPTHFHSSGNLNI